MKFLKRAEGKQHSLKTERDTQAIVQEMLDRIRQDGEAAIRQYALDFDGWDGEFVLSDIVDVIELCEL
jgi:sulfopropanediol 3-dehydrogenase